MNNLKKLPKFIHQCMTIGEIPTSYKVSLTYEEQLIWFCRFLEEQVIPVVNNNSEVVQELKTFVENYFDNLDIQEEVDNKLEEMLESGELEELITEYLNIKGLLCFNTKAEMKSAENLVNGSFVKTYGTTTYNDGYGNFYKIREIQNTDVVDDENIIALTNYNNLIAELIPNAYINSINNQIEYIENKVNPFNINLENLLFYDTDRTPYLQGCCVDENNNMYIYEETSFPYGDLLILNIETLSYVNKISNLKLYHGNDMCYLDGKIYVASCKADDGTLTNTKIVEYNISTGTLTEINPFSNTSYTDLFGIATYDENHLICILNKGTELFENLGLYLYNINNGDIQEIEITNSKNLQTNFWYAFQSMEYKDNKLYLLVSISDAILEFNVENNVADLEVIYNLPNIDIMGQTTVEYEGISKIPSNLYGNDTFVLYTNAKLFETQKSSAQVYLINFKSNVPAYLIPNVTEYKSWSNRRQALNVNNSSTSLYENGSETYPFKTLTRAINFLNSAKDKSLYSGTININGGDNYIIGCYSNKKFVLLNNTNGNININFNSNLAFYNRCRMQFIGYNGKKIILNLPTSLQIDDTELKADYCDFIYTGSTDYDALIEESGGANKVNISSSTANLNNHCNYFIKTNNNSINFLGVETISNSKTAYYYRTNGMSLSIIPPTQTDKYTDTGSAWATVIKAGTRLTT